MQKQHFIILTVVAMLATIGSCKDTITVTDIDGNVYETVQIGTQIWMKQNLKVAHYRDGSAIKEIEDKDTWENTEYTHTPAWCYYDGNAENNATYGKLYNWYAVANPRNICPPGWHVATDADFKLLSGYLGGDKVAGGKMKAVTLWSAPNNGADNSSGFTALPAGCRGPDGNFGVLGNHGYFWYSTPGNSTYEWYRLLDFDNSNCGLNNDNEGAGFSVRCVKD